MIASKKDKKKQADRKILKRIIEEMPVSTTTSTCKKAKSAKKHRSLTKNKKNSLERARELIDAVVTDQHREEIVKVLIAQALEGMSHAQNIIAPRILPPSLLRDELDEQKIILEIQKLHNEIESFNLLKDDISKIKQMLEES